MLVYQRVSHWYFTFFCHSDSENLPFTPRRPLVQKKSQSCPEWSMASAQHRCTLNKNSPLEVRENRTFALLLRLNMVVGTESQYGWIPIESTKSTIFSHVCWYWIPYSTRLRIPIESQCWHWISMIPPSKTCPIKNKPVKRQGFVRGFSTAQFDGTIAGMLFTQTMMEVFAAFLLMKSPDFAGEIAHIALDENGNHFIHICLSFLAFAIPKCGSNLCIINHYYIIYTRFLMFDINIIRFLWINWLNPTAIDVDFSPDSLGPWGSTLVLGIRFIGDDEACVLASDWVKSMALGDAVKPKFRRKSIMGTCCYIIDSRYHNDTLGF